MHTHLLQTVIEIMISERVIMREKAAALQTPLKHLQDFPL